MAKEFDRLKESAHRITELTEAYAVGLSETLERLAEARKVSMADVITELILTTRSDVLRRVLTDQIMRIRNEMIDNGILPTT